MNDHFNARSLDEKYSFLDDLPSGLYEKVVTNLTGSLRLRTQTILHWRYQLLKGEIPSFSQFKWPDSNLQVALDSEFQKLNIARFCKDQNKLTDAVLSEVLDIISQSDKKQRTLYRSIFQELKRIELERLEKKRISAKEKKSKPVVLFKKTVQTLQNKALNEAKVKASEEQINTFHAKWSSRVSIWSELSEIFGDISQLLGRGWDLSTSLINSQGWLEMVRLSNILKHVPELKELVRVLGRMNLANDTTETTSVLESIFKPIKRVYEELQDVSSPLAVQDTRGITRSDDITRMLPAEAMLLIHPTLRYLWHAKRVERSLSCYLVEGLLSSYQEIESVEMKEKSKTPQQKKLNRGPIILCVDTSGSMHGLPEIIAKAISLEALRVAISENRKCFVISFSGPKQIKDHELELSETGLSDFMEFLLYSFHGGTDISGPLKLAISKIGSSNWERSDILILSDGEFPLDTELANEINKTKEKLKLRVHGVLIGNDESVALQKLCDQTHKFNRWETITEFNSIEYTLN